MLKEAFDSGSLGEVVSIYSQRFGAGHGFLNAFEPSWRTNKDLLCGMCIESISHDIDMLSRIAGDIDTVSAVVSETIPSLPGFDNNVSASFRTVKGAVGSIHASWTSHIGHSERGVIGTKGSAVIAGDDLFSFEEFTIRTQDMPYPRVTKVGELFSLIEDHSYDRVNKHFMDCIINDTAPGASGEDGLRALRISHAMLESSRLGKAIKIN
jgi:myo-inositol 2-dehydrogenase/D-chiro-inositol 1-dehydrogenase